MGVVEIAPRQTSRGGLSPTDPDAIAGRFYSGREEFGAGVGGSLHRAGGGCTQLGTQSGILQPHK